MKNDHFGQTADNQETLKTIYYSLVQPYFDYCDVVWGDCSKTRADKLQKLQNRAARIITRADYSIRSSDVLNSLEWSNLEERRKRHLLVTMFKIFNNDCPTYLREQFQFQFQFRESKKAIIVLGNKDKRTVICAVLGSFTESKFSRA